MAPTPHTHEVVVELDARYADARQQYNTCHIVQAVVDTVAHLTEADPDTVISDHLGGEVTARFDYVGLFDHDPELEAEAWPESVRSRRVVDKLTHP